MVVVCFDCAQTSASGHQSSATLHFYVLFQGIYTDDIPCGLYGIFALSVRACVPVLVVVLNCAVIP